MLSLNLSGPCTLATVQCQSSLDIACLTAYAKNATTTQVLSLRSLEYSIDFSLLVSREQVPFYHKDRLGTWFVRGLRLQLVLPKDLRPTSLWLVVDLYTRPGWMPVSQVAFSKAVTPFVLVHVSIYSVLCGKAALY